MSTCNARLLNADRFSLVKISSLRGSVVAEELCHKTKVVGSRHSEANDIFNLPNPSGHTRPWGLLSLKQK
jgi:hypothetical protein